MGVWTDHAVPRVLHMVMRGKVLEDLRRRTVQGMSGRVLDIGFGTGLSLPTMPDSVDQLDVLDPSDTAWEMSARARRRSPIEVRRLPMPADGAVPAPDDTYDGVVIMFTLCTVPDPGQTLREVARVLKPGGELRFLEHGLDPRPGAARVLHVMDPVQRALIGGCHLVREPQDLLRSAGYTPTGVSSAKVPLSAMLPTVNHLTRGVAVP